MDLASPNGAFVLRLHESLWAGLTGAAGIQSNTATIGAWEVGKLKKFIDTCDNPDGQRADLARSVITLAHVAGGLLNVVHQSAYSTFWDAVGT